MTEGRVTWEEYFEISNRLSRLEHPGPFPPEGLIQALEERTKALEARV